MKLIKFFYLNLNFIYIGKINNKALNLYEIGKQELLHKLKL